MVQVTPTLPGKGLSYACSVYGASLLVLPDSSLDAVSVRGSLCTQGEINQALLYQVVEEGSAGTESRPTAFNRSELIDRLGGDVDLFGDVVRLFLDDCPKRLAAIDDALA